MKNRSTNRCVWSNQSSDNSRVTARFLRERTSFKADVKTNHRDPSRRKVALSPSQLATRSFKALVEIDIPLTAEVTVNARSPQEADELVQVLLQKFCCPEKLQRIQIQTIRAANTENQQVGIRLLSEDPPEISVCEIVDLATGEHCGPYVRLA